MIVPMKRAFGRVACWWLVLILLFSGAGSLNASEKRCSFTPECDGGVTFHLVGVDGLKPKEELVLMSQGGGPVDWRVYLPEKAWKEVVVERCSGPRKCEMATNAKIWIEDEHTNEKSVSGRYEVAFGEQHLQGQFLTTFAKHKPTIYCE
jgi:hypothetical protein